MEDSYQLSNERMAELEENELYTIYSDDYIPTPPEFAEGDGCCSYIARVPMVWTPTMSPELIPANWTLEDDEHFYISFPSNLVKMVRCIHRSFKECWADGAEDSSLFFSYRFEPNYIFISPSLAKRRGWSPEFIKNRWGYEFEITNKGIKFQIIMHERDNDSRMVEGILAWDMTEDVHFDAYGMNEVKDIIEAMKYHGDRVYAKRNRS